MPVKPRPLIDRVVEKISAPPYKTYDLWHEEYPLLNVFPFDRFECWQWTGAMSDKGEKGGLRPTIQTGGRGSKITHVFRIMLALKDRVPLSRRYGYHACHDEKVCSDTKCVNPFHGYWGTPNRNHEDREQYRPDTFKRKRTRRSA